MQTRTFDLLTAPVEPGAVTTTAANLSWVNPRNFVATPAAGIEFSVDATATVAQDDGSLLFDVHVTNKGVRARFAAVVTCDTDESTAETPRTNFGWPALIE